MQIELPRYDVGKRLPKDIMSNIFERLTEKELSRAKRVCRFWNVMGQDLRVTHKFAVALGARCWQQQFGYIGVEPALPANIAEILKEPCPFYPGKPVQETHLLALIPATVNGKPLTLDSLGEMSKNPKWGPAAMYSYYWEPIKTQYGAQSPAKSYWILMTKNVLPGSLGKHYSEQQAMMATYSDYRVPMMLEAVTSILLHFVKSGERLFSNHPIWIYTQCQEIASANSWQCTVGGFIAAGLSISCVCARDNVGIAAIRQL